jgi:hypothetical protein
MGHRGGECQRLGVSVKGQWAACALMIPNVNPTTRTLNTTAISEAQGSAIAYLRLSSAAKLDSPPELASA